MENKLVLLGGGGHCKSVIDAAIRMGKFPVIIDPSATLSDSAIVGEGTFIGKNAVINADTKIGKHCIINTGAIVEHECQVEDFSHISVGTILFSLSDISERMEQRWAA